MWATIIGAVIAAGASIWGAYANQEEAKKSQNEAKGLDSRNFGAQQSQTDFQNRFATEQAASTNALNKQQLQLSKDQLALNRNQFGEQVRMSNVGIAKDEVARIQNLLNTNVGLRDKLLGTWSNMGGR